MHRRRGSEASDGARDERHPVAVAVLKGMVVLFELLCLAAQCIIVPLSGEAVAMYPETAPMRWLYVVLGILAVACFEIALAGLWRLLTMVRRHDVFSGEAMRPVNLIIGCAGAEGAVVFVVLLLSTVLEPPLIWDSARGAFVPAAVGMPALSLALVVALLLIVAFIMLMLVMRSLLAQATAQRDELAVVI
ncbi:DUF2975 domain-containing protein [Bifidobacterium eulemuris]|nr:DUF2975 domain-containing protein [Bifidobacterium eulemuris]